MRIVGWWKGKITREREIFFSLLAYLFRGFHLMAFLREESEEGVLGLCRESWVRQWAVKVGLSGTGPGPTMSEKQLRWATGWPGHLCPVHCENMLEPRG